MPKTKAALKTRNQLLNRQHLPTPIPPRREHSPRTSSTRAEAPGDKVVPRETPSHDKATPLQRLDAERRDGTDSGRWNGRKGHECRNGSVGEAVGGQVQAETGGEEGSEVRFCRTED